MLYAYDTATDVSSPPKGHTATLSLTNGEKYTGIFSSIATEQSESRYLLKMVKKLPSEKQANGTSEASDGYVGTGANHAMTFSGRDVADFQVDNVRLDRTPTRAAQNGKLCFLSCFASTLLIQQ
jgi:hypothetical protein